MNDLLRFLSEWDLETPQARADKTPYILRWPKTVGNDSASESLLELLRVNGRIVGGRSLEDDEKNALGRAVKKGMVFPDNGQYFPSSAA